MRIAPHATGRWLLAFVLLSLAGVGAWVWALWPTHPAEGADGPAAMAAAVAAVPTTRLSVAPLAGARVTVAAGPAGLGGVEVDGAALLRRARSNDEAYELSLDPGAASATVLLPSSRLWLLDLGGGFAHLRLALEALEVDTLRVPEGVTSVEGTLPATGRGELVLGAGRSALLVPRGADLELRLRLAAGPLLLRVEPETHGELVLTAGSGPATLVVDASVNVALVLPSGDAPPLALEGSWWRHRVGDAVTWVRSPVPLGPADAELRVTLTSHAGAPLAITYR